MALRVLFEGTVPKHTESPDENEDAYRVAPEAGRVVLSDGASESFDARSWARLLVEQLLDQDLSREVLGSCAQAYEGCHDPTSLSWSKAAAYERGSFATIVIAQDLPARLAVSITAAGDSLAVWSDGAQLLGSFPYTRADQFEEKPTLLATRLALNGVGSDEAPGWTSTEWGYEADGYRTLLCMTDALGAWLLRHEEQGDPSALERLLAIREPQELHGLVEAERAAGRIRRDDSTLVIASLTRSP